MKRLALVLLALSSGCVTLEIRAKNGDTGAMAELIVAWATEAPEGELMGADLALPAIHEAALEPKLRALLAATPARPDVVRKGAARAVARMLAERPEGLEKCVEQEQDVDLLDACLHLAMARNVKLGKEVLERLTSNAVKSVAALARKALGVGSPLAGLKGSAPAEGEAAPKKEEEEVPIWMRGRAPEPIFERHPKRGLSLPALFGGKQPEKSPAQKKRESLMSALKANDILAIDKPHLVAALDESDRSVKALAAAALLTLSRQGKVP